MSMKHFLRAGTGAPATALLGLALLIVTGERANAQATNVQTAATSTDTTTATTDSSTSTEDIATVVVTAKHLNDARSGIETQTGASTYTIDAAAIAATPGGDNVQLNQVLLQ